MECGSSLTACSAHGSTPGKFFCPGAQHSFCCKEHCCYLTSFDGRIIAQKSDFVNRHYRKRGKKQEMGNGKLAQGCQSGVVGEGTARPGAFRGAKRRGNLVQALPVRTEPRRKQQFQISTPHEKWENFSEKYFEILLLCAILHLQVLHGVQFLFIRSNGEVMT